MANLNKERLALVEDAQVTLENERPFYQWCMLYLPVCSLNEFIKQAHIHCSTARLLYRIELEVLKRYFHERYFPAPKPTTDYTITVDNAGCVSGFGLYNSPIYDDKIDSLIHQINQTLKETPVSKLTFKQQFLLNGTDISSIPNNEIYVLIQQEETRIANLEKIQTKPKRLTAEIEEAKANLTAIVAHLDSK